jgi:uncharacterized integral membrane protein
MRVLPWLVLILIGVFAALNWPQFNAEMPLWLGFTTVFAPLGVVMLGLLGIVVVLLLIEQGAALAESRRYSRELDSQRRLADNAESSRYTELRAYLGEELARSDQRALDIRSALMQRLDALEREMRLALGQPPAAPAPVASERVTRGERHDFDIDVNRPIIR